MRLIVSTLLVFVIAGAIGLGTTWYTMARVPQFSAMTIGAWTARPKSGTADIDPYARAAVARTGELPLGIGDGVAFFAETDDAGTRLDGRCDVTVAGMTPPARFWTLTLYDRDGRLVETSAGRHGFTSQEIVRGGDGRIDIRIAPRARAGNWLPTGGLERYVLALRFYDTPIGVTTKSARDLPMPTITLTGCPQ